MLHSEESDIIAHYGRVIGCCEGSGESIADIAAITVCGCSLRESGGLCLASGAKQWAHTVTME